MPHDGGTTDPDAVRAAARGRGLRDLPAAQLLRLPRAGPRARRRGVRAPGALPVAHVDLMSLGVLEAPGDYGCALAIGEGQSAGNHMSLRRPALRVHGRQDRAHPASCPAGSSARRTTATGRRGYVLTLQTREQHIRREKATSNITTNQTLLALAGLVYLSWLGPEGLRDIGRACLSLAEDAKRGRRPAAGVRPADVQGVRASDLRPAGRGRGQGGARKLGVHPGYPLGRDYPGMDDVLLVRRDREAHARRHRPAGARCCASVKRRL